MSALNPRRLVVAAAVSVVACSNGPADLGQGSACKSSLDCADGLLCDSGRCHAACNLTSDCPAGNQCTGGLCEPLAHGACARDADCIDPPGTCHLLAGATCDGGVCNYPRKTGGSCGEPCTVANTCMTPGTCQTTPASCVESQCSYAQAPDGYGCQLSGANGVCSQGQCVGCNNDGDCNPLNHGLDRCSTGACSNHACAFTPITDCPYKDLATDCSSDDDCKSGHCADGICCDSACDDVCEQCTAGTGKCDTKPDDEAACGLVVCTGLSNICRHYSNLNGVTHHRCAALGRCAQDNSPTDCVVYDDADDGTACRGSAGPCDIEESCASGVCPPDQVVQVGDHCIGTSGDDVGVCDSTQQCKQLHTFAAADRYFLEESSLSANLVDAEGKVDLTATYNDDVFAKTDITGRGLSWGAPSASSSYCANGTDSVLAAPRTNATLEVDFTASLGTYNEEWIAGFASAGAPFALSLSHDANDADATLTAYYNGTAVTYTIDPSPARLIVHLVYDSAQGTASNRLRVYVNGSGVSGTGTLPSQYATLGFGGVSPLCVGNAVTGYAAFTGTIWYAALYAGTPTSTQIHDAVARLSISDAP